MNYLKETGQWAVLGEKAPFAAKPGTKTTETGTLHEHAVRAIEKALTRLSPRGLPLMGEADWNDGLSAAGWGGKGESVWMGHFLYGVLRDWAEVIDHAVAQRAPPPKDHHSSPPRRSEAIPGEIGASEIFQ
jgi:cellobiose phosphorylase